MVRTYLEWLVNLPWYHAFLWDGTIQDLGTLAPAYDFSSSQALAVNAVGQVAGYSSTPVFPHAFLWNGTMQDLGTLGSYGSWAADINDAGQVVGWSGSGSLDSHAFLWDGTMIDLGTLGGSVSWARAVNDAGQVVGISTTESGEWHATLWRILTPVEQLEACARQSVQLETDGVLNQGQARSLVNKINVATALLNDGKTIPAIKTLEAFQFEASALVEGGQLTPEQSDQLIVCIQDALDSL